ncbi:MAG: AraC family transcriptional regulator [Arenicellales bacterium]
MTFTEVCCDASPPVRPRPVPDEDAYLIALMMRECQDHVLYVDGRPVETETYPAGVTVIYDLRSDVAFAWRSPFHCVQALVPRKVLDTIASEAGAPRIDGLRCQPGVGMEDPVIRHLLSSLLPCLRNPDEANEVFVNQVALAVGAHIAQAYGGVRLQRQARRGGLAPWQEQRAKELLRASLDAPIPLARLAQACGLSSRHFARAFRQSTGVPPHRWLLKERVERAKKLLQDPDTALADIALSCGFSDQSHFTRVFSATLGTSPGAWRRMRMRPRDSITADLKRT